MTHSRAIAALSCCIAVFAVAWGYAQQRATGSMLTPQDYIDIQQLYASYNHAVDAGDATAFAANFMPDGALGNAVGRDALIETVNRTKQQWKGTWRHLYSNLIIKPTPEGASGSLFTGSEQLQTGDGLSTD